MLADTGAVRPSLAGVYQRFNFPGAWGTAAAASPVFTGGIFTSFASPTKVIFPKSGILPVCPSNDVALIGCSVTSAGSGGSAELGIPLAPCFGSSSAGCNYRQDLEMKTQRDGLSRVGKLNLKGSFPQDPAVTTRPVLIINHNINQGRSLVGTLA